MNTNQPQSYFELAATRRADLERSLAEERSLADERASIDHRPPRYVRGRRRLVAAGVGAIAVLGGLTVHAFDTAADPAPGGPIEVNDRPPVHRPSPLPARSPMAPIAV